MFIKHCITPVNIPPISILFFSILFLLSIKNTYAQTPAPYGISGKWRIKVITLEQSVLKGNFWGSDSDSIWVKTSTGRFETDYSIAVGSDKIYKLKFRRKGRPLIGFFTGLVTGIAIGVYLGSTTPEDPLHPNKKSEAINKAGFIFGSILSISGALLGSSYTDKYVIKGNRNEYLKHLEIFKSYQ